ncbi:hypothetical protein [Luteimonas huabeiensis]|uniref:hypothetical protein n=1 Tax=Luteimonas huabeiensis TaxID=1244513 RepID=UPI0004635D9A|nr:hypothetical protein [Luteimonas huabeiensis]
MSGLRRALGALCLLLAAVAAIAGALAIVAPHLFPAPPPGPLSPPSPRWRGALVVLFAVLVALYGRRLLDRGDDPP